MQNFAFDLPSGKRNASVKSPMRLNSSNAKITALVDSFVDSKATKTYNNETSTIDQALLKLSFPSLETGNNIFTFNLRFPNKTVKTIAQEIYLFELKENLPAGTTKIAKAILAMCDADGVILYNSLQDFASNYKLPRSTSKLYSILRENKTEFDLSDLSALAGSELSVQTYYHSKMKDFTIATTDYVAKSSFDLEKTKDNTPRSKRSASLW